MNSGKCLPFDVAYVRICFLFHRYVELSVNIDVTLHAFKYFTDTTEYQRLRKITDNYYNVTKQYPYLMHVSLQIL